MFRSSNTIKFIRRTLIAIIATSSLTACQINQQDNQTTLNKRNGMPTLNSALFPSVQAEFQNASPDEIERLLQKYEVKSRILDQYDGWKGVKYRLGGSTKKGIDCSALVQITFHEQFGLNLPRTTNELRHIGKTIAKNQLKAGDLVHFQIDRNTHHVGIYLGNNQFMHASSSKGVMISNLTDNYWTKRYQSASRILKEGNINHSIASNVKRDEINVKQVASNIKRIGSNTAAYAENNAKHDEGNLRRVASNANRATNNVRHLSSNTKRTA